MAKKRRVFDINFEADDDVDERFPAGNRPAPETKSLNPPGPPVQNEGPERRGPMASAISESAAATAERAGAEAAIRAENDALAHEHVRLKKLGLITDLIETARVKTTKMTRDRRTAPDPELQELKDSIQAIGLSNPIRVEQTDEGFELIQGFRRLSAFQALAEETGDRRYTRIPAAMVPRGEPVSDLYRKMVDENLVRKDISFGEMAALALSFARDTEITHEEAVKTLYASALKQKRRYILQFTHVLAALGEALLYPEALPRSLGLELHKFLDGDGERAEGIKKQLRRQKGHGAEAEVKLLRDVISQAPTKKPIQRPVAKTSLRLARPEGEARVSAQNGRVDIRLSKDFSAVSKERLQAGIEAFLATIEKG